MALLKKVSIKWKLSFALIATGLTLVSSYVLIAKRVFESDKISYVFEAQGSRLESTKSEIESKFERALLGARSVIATFDISLAKLSTAGEQIFGEEKTLLALELWNEEKAQTVLRLEKQPSILPPSNARVASAPVGQIEIQPLDRGKFLMNLRYNQPDQGTFRLRAALEMVDLLPKASTTQSIALIQGERVVLISDLRGIPQATFDELAKGSQSATERTRMWRHNNDRFLVSEVPLSIAKLRLVALTPEAEALGALGTLFRRSIVFLILSVFSLIAVSLTLARGLTLNLRVLTKSAEEIGAGNFDATTPINSEDEMGVLARAFSKMSQEIKRLLVETREKARMEEELKTASLVQERLMPKQATAAFGEMEVSGLVLTSSECGGDWWYFFTRGDELFVAIADATGHGTPAALITATARSIFSRLENEDLSLGEMMRAWDFAVSSCSQKEVFMTGILLRINSLTGEGVFVNAAHESPFLFRAEEDGTFSSDFLATGKATARIGDDIDPDIVETPFSLAPNESLVLYTDGLFSIARPDGKNLSEKRFGKTLATRAEFVKSAEQMTQITLKAFNDHRENLPLPDDVSIVSLRRRGPERRAFLKNDSGQVHIDVSN